MRVRFGGGRRRAGRRERERERAEAKDGRNAAVQIAALAGGKSEEPIGRIGCPSKRRWHLENRELTEES
jgi:hypothetical protein